ncbi:MAG: DUF3861 family protein [Pseudoxanthomonas sp.]
MDNASRRYRITVTPVESDGLPCFHRCSLEFDHTSAHDLMRRVESTTTRHALPGNESTSVVVGLSLLELLLERGSPETRQLLTPLAAGLRQQLETTWAPSPAG